MSLFHKLAAHFFLSHVHKSLTPLTLSHHVVWSFFLPHIGAVCWTPHSEWLLQRWWSRKSFLMVLKYVYKFLTTLLAKGGDFSWVLSGLSDLLPRSRMWQTRHCVSWKTLSFPPCFVSRPSFNASCHVMWTRKHPHGGVHVVRHCSILPTIQRTTGMYFFISRKMWNVVPPFGMIKSITLKQ